MSTRQTSLVRAAAGLALALTAASCAATDPYRDVVKSGFLKESDYARLQEGEEGQPALFWVADDAEIGRYRRIKIEPVVVYLAPDKLEEMTEEEQYAIAYRLRDRLVDALRDDYSILEVDQDAGPDTLVIRAAVTGADKSFVPLNVLSTVVPEGLVLSKLSQYTIGWRPFVGKASVEAEILDGTSRRPLVQLVDARIGNKTVDTGLLRAFGDVEGAFDYWSEELDEWLAREREGVPASQPADQ